MTALNKQALRERYSSQLIPKCHICGAEMTVQRISASRITYGCTGATYDDAGYHYAEGRSIADYHYEQSRVIVVDVSDPDVLALLDELEAKDKRIAELEAMQGKPVMFIDGDISPADADKLAAVIREFNEETESPAARMARIIRENPHPTNMCDIPAAGIGVKGE